MRRSIALEENSHNEVLRVEGVVPRPQADKTGGEANRTTEGEDDWKPCHEVVRVEGVVPRP